MGFRSGRGDQPTLTISGALSVDSPTLVVDEANDRVGIGTASPSHDLTVAGTISGSIILVDHMRLTGTTDPQLKINYDGANYANFAVSSIGNLFLDTSGKGIILKDDNKLWFGNDQNASIEYDEDGTDELIISGAFGGIDIIVPDNDSNALEIKEASTAYLTIQTTNGQEGVIFNQNGQIVDDKFLYFGSAANAFIEYDADNRDRLRISGSTLGTEFSGSVYFGAGVGGADGQHIIAINPHDDKIDFFVAGGANAGVNINGPTTMTGSGDYDVFKIEAGSSTGNNGKPALIVHENGVGIRVGSPTTVLDVAYDPSQISNDTGGGHRVYYGTGSTTTGKLYFLNTVGGWQIVDADDANEGANQLLGIALGGDPQANGMLLEGYFDAHTYLMNFDKGKAVFSRTLPGYMDTIAPSGSGDAKRIIGYCTDQSNVIKFKPDGYWEQVQ